ncbi:hypothetical protein [Actinomadura terrae]|uniref:hypothetical protein n=1 Tax=Actinomadura terrae TaxID=604353 RepID=UPI001FA7915C|nr:hypothetical protein [Actinomadura terrae]
MPRSLPIFDEDDPLWREAARALFVVWAARTGRRLRHVPVERLSARELEDFWADDQLDEDSLPQARPTHQALVAVDIVAFGAPGRDTRVQIRLRETMYTQVERALGGTGLALSDCHHEDRGDGAFIVAPGDADPCDLLDPFAHDLAAHLRSVNRHADPGLRLRLRAAVHYGHVDHDAHGVVGRAPVDLFRHLEAPAFRRAMAATPSADLGVIVSDSLFREAGHRGGRLDHDAYRPIRVNVKETRTRAWLWLPPRCG